MDLLKTRRELEKGKNLYDLPLRVVFYARVSTDRDEQLHSLSNQVSYYEGYIKERSHWTYSGGYIDEGLSGTSVNKREDFLRMIDDASRDRFDLILTKEISRFSRSTLDSIRYTQELLDYGVGVYFQNDNINTLFTDSELRLTIMASIAQDEVRRLSERVKFGMKRAYENGRVLGSTNIYGYDKKDGKLTVNEREAGFVRALFHLYAEGTYGFRSVARQLGEMGYTNQSGGEINPGTLRAMIENPKYKGYYCGRITESNNYRQKKNIKLPPEERVLYQDPSIPVIVPEALWEKANAVLHVKRDRYKKKSDGTQNRFGYSGKIICEEHGVFHYRKVWKDRKTPVEGWCCKIYLAKGRKGCGTPHLHTEDLDWIVAFIGERLLGDKRRIVGRLFGRYAEIGGSGTDYAKEIARLSSEAERVLLKKERLLELSLDGAVETREFIAMNARLSKQLEDNAAQMERLKREQSRSQNPAAIIENARVALETRIDERELILAAAREVLDRVVVARESVGEHFILKIRLRYSDELTAHLLKPSGTRKNRTSAVILYGDTEISPIVGTEKQSEDLIAYFKDEMAADPNKVWELNMFGKSMHDLVKDGLQTKLYRMPEEAQMKLQETLQKMINESTGGLICILL